MRATRINNDMKISAASAIANLISDNDLSPDFIIPNALDLRVPPAVAAAVAESAIKTQVAQIQKDPAFILERTKNYLYEGFLRNI